MILPDQEFIRRFSQHILPKGFVRIRHYGFLSSGWKKYRLPKLQQQLGLKRITPDAIEQKPMHHRRCRACGNGILCTICIFTRLGPPLHWLESINDQKSGL